MTRILAIRSWDTSPRIEAAATGFLDLVQTAAVCCIRTAIRWVRSPGVPILIALLLVPSLAWAQPFKCTVTRVLDGDTFACDSGISKPLLAEYQIRLFGLDAPERPDQPGGTQAWIALRALIQARTLNCMRHDVDRFDRAVATCAHPMVPGDVGAQLVREGMAHCWPRYSQRYCDLQEMAKADRVGIWAADNPMPPWKFRARKR